MIQKNNFSNKNIKQGHAESSLLSIFDPRSYENRKPCLVNDEGRRSRTETFRDDGLYVYERQTARGFTPSLVTPQGFCAGYSEGCQNAALYPALQHCGMTNAAHGFTLIELLVVVLIIGILAAVALPQYQKAVKKARFSKLQSTAHSLYRGVDAFYLATNSWPNSFDEMDIDFPGEPSQQNKCKTNNEMYCCVIAPVPTMNNGQIVCGQTDYSFAYRLLYADHYYKKPVQPYGTCYEREGTNLCRAVTQKNGTDDSMLTPLGFLQRKAFVISND